MREVPFVSCWDCADRLGLVCERGYDWRIDLPDAASVLSMIRTARLGGMQVGDPDLHRLAPVLPWQCQALAQLVITKDSHITAEIRREILSSVPPVLP